MTKLFYCVLLVSRKKKIVTDALTLRRKKNWGLRQTQKKTGARCSGKKSVCALRGILWNVFAFLVFSCVELDNYALNDIFETLT